MSIAVWGYDPKKMEKDMSHDVYREQEKYKAQLKYTGKMSQDEIDMQATYHQTVHGLLYSPECKIETISMSEEENQDVVTVKFIKPKMNEKGEYNHDYSSMSMMKTKMKDNPGHSGY